MLPITHWAGLPDGIFSNQKSQFGCIFQGLGMENVGTYMYFMVIWYILLPFGTFCGLLTNFSRIWYVVPIKIWPPCSNSLVHRRKDFS
jgi:hypothetical protein